MRVTRKLLAVVGLVIAMVAVAMVPAVADEYEDPVAAFIEALGGADAVGSIETITAVASGRNWSIDEGFIPNVSTRPAGPYSSTTVIDVPNFGANIDLALASLGINREVTEIISGELGALVGQDGNFAPPGENPMTSDRWASTLIHLEGLYPQLLALAALDDPSIASAIDANTIVIDAFIPATIHLDPQTHLPRKTVFHESDPLRRDTTAEFFYGGWQADESGVLFSARVVVRYAGFVVQREKRSSISVNDAVDPALFAFPVGVEPVFDPALAARGFLSHQFLESFASLGFPLDGLQTNVVGTELAPGVHWITGGSHNSLVIEQDDGVVVVEAALGMERSEAVLDWIAANLGDVAVTHVIQSHHHADHSAGIRTYVGHGATAVFGEAAAGLYDVVFNAPSVLQPDALSMNPVDVATVQIPDGGTVLIGGVTNPIGAHSLAVGHAQDYVLVDVGGVLWVVDIYQPAPGAPVPPEGLLIRDRVVELGLDIDVIAGGHAATISWDEFLSLLPD